MDKPVIIITGASSGIGAATALRLAREGARLILAARRADRLKAVGAEAERLGAEVHIVPMNVLSLDDTWSNQRWSAGRGLTS
jgi:NADP-dependent 3-hydroxy acid dehydrogenase YdfG